MKEAKGMQPPSGGNAAGEGKTPDAASTDTSKTSETKRTGRSASRGTLDNSSVLALDRFARTFEVSARRWEMVVYPSLFAFIILAAYGFYLVYSLTRDMHDLASNMDPAMYTHMEIMSNSMSSIAGNVARISARVEQMASSVEGMDTTVVALNDSMGAMKIDLNAMVKQMYSLEPMLVNMSEMNKAIHAMNESVHGLNANTAVMSRDVGMASYQFSRPMSTLNSFFPW